MKFVTIEHKLATLKGWQQGNNAQDYNDVKSTVSYWQMNCIEIAKCCTAQASTSRKEKQYKETV